MNPTILTAYLSLENDIFGVFVGSLDTLDIDVIFTHNGYINKQLTMTNYITDHVSNNGYITTNKSINGYI